MQINRAHGPKLYTVNLTGKELHHLLEIIERQAIEQHPYQDVRLAVYLVERIRPQLREQDFYENIEDPNNRVLLPIQTPEGFNVGKS